MVNKEKRNEQIVKMFLNYKTQREACRKFGLAGSTVNEILHRRLTKKQIDKVKAERIKMTAKKYQYLYLKKNKTLNNK